MAVAQDIVLKWKIAEFVPGVIKFGATERHFKITFFLLHEQFRLDFSPLTLQMCEFPADNAQALLERAVVTIAISTAVAFTVTCVNAFVE